MIEVSWSFAASASSISSLWCPLACRDMCLGSILDVWGRVRLGSCWILQLVRWTWVRAGRCHGEISTKGWEYQGSYRIPCTMSKGVCKYYKTVLTKFHTTFHDEQHPHQTYLHLAWTTCRRRHFISPSSSTEIKRRCWISRSAKQRLKCKIFGLVNTSHTLPFLRV